MNPRRRVYLWVLFYQKNCRKTRTINHDPTCMHPTVYDAKEPPKRQKLFSIFLVHLFA